MKLNNILRKKLYFILCFILLSTNYIQLSNTTALLKSKHKSTHKLKDKNNSEKLLKRKQDKPKEVNQAKQPKNTEEVKETKDVKPQVSLKKSIISDKDLQDKQTFRLFEALRLMAITTRVLRPVEFIFAKIKEQPEAQKITTKCSKNVYKTEYTSLIKSNLTAIKSVNMESIFKTRLENINSKCDKFISDTNNLHTSIVEEKKKPLPEFELTMSLTQTINDSKNCLKKFQSWQNNTKIDTTNLEPPCNNILSNLGCGISPTQIKSCLDGKKDSNGIVYDSPIKVAEEISKIQFNPSAKEDHPLLKAFEEKHPQNCKVFSKFGELNKEGMSPFLKYISRIKSALSIFLTILKCNGVYKDELEVFSDVKLKTLMQMIVNFLTLDNLPSSDFRLRWYVGGFVKQTIYYFFQKIKAKEAKNDKEKAVAFIMMSRHFGASIGYLIRSLIHIFKNDLNLIFKESSPNNSSSIVANKDIDGEKVFNDWNI